MGCICQNLIRYAVSARYRNEMHLCDKSPGCKGQFCARKGRCVKCVKWSNGRCVKSNMLWDDNNGTGLGLSAESSVNQRLSPTISQLVNKQSLHDRGWGPLRFYLNKINPHTKKVVCTMLVSIDFQLCTKNTTLPKGPQRNKPFWFSDGKFLDCNAAMVKKPISTSLVYPAAGTISHDLRAQCRNWFTIVDGGVRGVVSVTTSMHSTRRIYECNQQQNIASFMRNSRRRGVQTLGEDAEGGAGRRGGGFGASSTFILGASSNRAGNSETL